MGFKYDDKCIVCPLYKRVVRTRKGAFLGIECEELPVNLGFDTTRCIRLRNSEELRAYTEVFCKGYYDTCPYYQAYMDFRQK